MNPEPPNMPPNIHELAEAYRKRTSLEMFGHENATPSEVIAYGNEKSRKDSSMRMFGHENATMAEMVAFDRQKKLTHQIKYVTASLFALRQLREDQHNRTKALNVIEQGVASEELQIADINEADLAISESDFERLIMEMKFAATHFASKLKTGARLGWDDNDLINSLFKTLDQIRNLNNNELPLCLQDVQSLINGKRTYNWQVDN